MKEHRNGANINDKIWTRLMDKRSYGILQSNLTLINVRKSDIVVEGERKKENNIIDITRRRAGKDSKQQKSGKESRLHTTKRRNNTGVVYVTNNYRSGHCTRILGAPKPGLRHILEELELT